MIEKQYQIDGMTCENCVVTIKENFLKKNEIQKVGIDLKQKKVTIQMTKNLSLAVLQSALPQKFTIKKNDNDPLKKTKKKWNQLRPLAIIFIYLILGSYGMHYKNSNLNDFMLSFMGLFFIVFSFFKVLDLKGFVQSFKNYDPLTQNFTFYGWIYPFIELGLGIFFLTRFLVFYALILTIVVLAITTWGILHKLINKKKIKCACLGSILNLPMTEATLIENFIMIIMAGIMLNSIFVN